MCIVFCYISTYETQACLAFDRFSELVLAKHAYALDFNLKTTLMNNGLLPLLFALSFSICFSQTNPEDVIVVYDSLHPNGKVILKSELGSDLDSLSIHLVDEKRKEILSKKDTIAIKTLLVGSWILQSTKRINGKSINLQTSKQMTFNENGNFVQIHENDTLKGKWFVKNVINGNLLLKYNKPYIPIKDKTILKSLSQEQIKAISFDSNILSITEINHEHLIFANFLDGNFGDINKMFYRLVLATYKRME